MYKGFTFANIHSSVFELYVRSDNRTIAPSLRKNELIIPGRHGTLDYGSNTYDTRLITMHLILLKKTMEDLRQQARDVAQWLSRDGLLIFDDEPDKAYQAKIYSKIDLEEIRAYGATTVTFECQPFATALVYNQVLQTITRAEEQIPLTNIGTQASPCRIIITNIGASNIRDIILTRLSTG